MEDKKQKRNIKGVTQNQPNNPLHGVKLVTILEHLIAEYGWREMGIMVDINCFNSNPSLKSSLKFLRQTPWARVKVEDIYLRSISYDENKND